MSLVKEKYPQRVLRDGGVPFRKPQPARVSLMRQVETPESEEHLEQDLTEEKAISGSSRKTAILPEHLPPQPNPDEPQAKFMPGSDAENPFMVSEYGKSYNVRPVYPVEIELVAHQSFSPEELSKHGESVMITIPHDEILSAYAKGFAHEYPSDSLETEFRHKGIVTEHDKVRLFILRGQSEMSTNYEGAPIGSIIVDAPFMNQKTVAGQSSAFHCISKPENHLPSKTKFNFEKQVHSDMTSMWGDKSFEETVNSEYKDSSKIYDNEEGGSLFRDGRIWAIAGACNPQLFHDYHNNADLTTRFIAMPRHKAKATMKTFEDEYQSKVCDPNLQKGLSVVYEPLPTRNGASAVSSIKGGEGKVIEKWVDGETKNGYLVPPEAWIDQRFKLVVAPMCRTESSTHMNIEIPSPK